MTKQVKGRTKTAKNESPSPGDYWFDQEKVDDVVNWVQTFCTHTVGDLQGEPLILPQWFIDGVVSPTFGWKKPNGTRRYQEVYEMVASGNAKSTLGQALAMYCFCHDSQMSPRVYCVAGSKEQAGIIFNGCKLMVQQNPELSAAITILRNSMTIQSEFGLGILMAISADSDTNEGLNPTAVFFDETHVQPNGKMYANLKKNFPKRKEPLMFLMTTAGVNFTWAHDYHIKACKVRDGIIKAPGMLTAIYEADPDGDDFDEAQWKKANPGWDYLNKEMIYQAAEDAKRSATDLSSFRRYRLNKWVAASNTWLTDAKWMKGTACEKRDDVSLMEFRNNYLTFDALRGRKCFVGLDLSSNRDTSAAAYVFPPITPGERIKIIIKVYIPQLSLYERAERETPLYLQWEQDGDIVVTPGENQDQELIFHDIQEAGKIVNIMGVAYDSHNAGEIVKLMEKSGIESKAYKQDFFMLNMPMRDVDNKLTQGKIEHGGHPVLRWHIGNTDEKRRMIGGAEYIMPTKSSDLARIDAVLAVLIAHGLMIWKMSEKDEEQSKSVVKNFGMTRIPLRR